MIAVPLRSVDVVGLDTAFTFLHEKWRHGAIGARL
jgi:hypothetical protein